MFHEYVQINPGELQKGQGTGLGLSISKSIVELHGGLIGMTSAGKGKGSTFFIELPVYKKIHDEDGSDASSRGRLSISSRIFSGGSGPTTRKPNSVRSKPPVSNRIAVVNTSEVIKTDDQITQFTERSKFDDHPDLNQKSEEETIIEKAEIDLEKGIKLRSSMSANSDVTEPPPMFVEDFMENTSPTISNIIVPAKISNIRGSILFAPKVYQILLVDDSIPNRKMLRRLLEREGHIISETSDGTEALSIMEKAKLDSPDINSTFDFILMDYYMSQLHGPQTTKKIRQLGYQNPIIGVTGVLDDDSDEFIQAGADVVLCKPVSLQNIWKALRSIKFLT